MSSQRGNVARTRSQKHQNKHVFKNDRYDTNVRTKRINMTQITNVCDKCKNILEWKIKYKKYKPLKVPKTCNRCSNKCVKHPYHTTCLKCALTDTICPKCGSKLNENTESTKVGVINENEIAYTNMAEDVASSSDNFSDDGVDS